MDQDSTYTIKIEWCGTSVIIQDLKNSIEKNYSWSSMFKSAHRYSLIGYI